MAKKRNSGNRKDGTGGTGARAAREPAASSKTDSTGGGGGANDTATATAPGPARLYALLAGAFVALLGVLGFFYDAGFGTGSSLADDDLAGILVVNGWRNLVYLLSGLLALGCAVRRPRSTALALGTLYLVFAIWGYAVTERGIGSILDALPLGDNDNLLHLVLGVLGISAAVLDGPLPALPRRKSGSKARSGSKPKGEQRSSLRTKSKAEQQPRPQGRSRSRSRSGDEGAPGGGGRPDPS